MTDLTEYLGDAVRLAEDERPFEEKRRIMVTPRRPRRMVLLHEVVMSKPTVEADTIILEALTQGPQEPAGGPQEPDSTAEAPEG